MQRFWKDKPLIDKSHKREAQKAAQAARKVAVKERLTLHPDCIYRSHVDPARIFGDDVSFCYGKFSDNLEHYKIVPFSEFSEGCVMFELTFLDDPCEILDYVEPIKHHPGAGRGSLPKDGLNISRIFLDPTEFKEESKELAYIRKLQQEQIRVSGEDSAITIVHINRSHIVEHMNSSSRPSIVLKFPHPNHRVESKEEPASKPIAKP